VHKVGQMLYRLTTLSLSLDFPPFSWYGVCLQRRCAHGTDYDKRICCGKANEKERRLYSREQTRMCSLRLCYRRRGDKQTTANRACDRFDSNVGHQNLYRGKQRKPRRSGAMDHKI